MMIKCVNCQKPFQRGELMQAHKDGEWIGGNHPITNFNLQNVGKHENWPRRHVDCNAKPIEIDFFEAYRGATVEVYMPRFSKVKIPIEEMYQAFKTRMQSELSTSAQVSGVSADLLVDDGLETHNPTKVANFYSEVAEHTTDRELTREQSAANLKAHNDVLRNFRAGRTACGKARVDVNVLMCVDKDCDICKGR